MEGNWLTEFMQARTWGLVDSAVFGVLWTLTSWSVGRISRSTFASQFALRTRICAGALLIVGLALVATEMGVPAPWVVIGSGLAFVVFIFVGLRGLASLGISNAFAKTSKGISAERSLKMVKKELAFLGIGASKLTSSDEFPKALARCKSQGKMARFLLSNPNNPELTRLARQNNKNDTSYKSRVEQSIRDIFHHGEKSGAKFEIRLYEMDNEKSLSKFRMMFIDDKTCLLSHVVWNASEGGDNSQIIIGQASGRGQEGLYGAYKEFFDDLWEANSSNVVDQDMIDRGFTD